MARQGINISVDAQDLISKTKQLCDLTNKNLLSIYKRALGTAASKTVVKESRSLLRSKLSGDSTGATAKAIGIKTAKRSPLVLLGAKTSGRYQGQLIHILDNGTVSRTTKSGKNTGKIQGLKIFETSFNSKSNDMLIVFNQKLQDNYTKAILKKIK